LADAALRGNPEAFLLQALKATFKQMLLPGGGKQIEAWSDAGVQRNNPYVLDVLGFISTVFS
jgi:hypothetical protein